MALTGLGTILAFLVGHIEGVDGAPNPMTRAPASLMGALVELVEGFSIATAGGLILTSLAYVDVASFSTILSVATTGDIATTSVMAGAYGGVGALFGYAVNVLGGRIRAALTPR